MGPFQRMRTSLLCYFLLVVAPVGAQRVTLTAPANLLHAPGGRVLATLKTGATVTLGAARSGFVQITVQGYVASRALGPPRDSFPLTIKDAVVELRTAALAGSQSNASLRQGMGLILVERRGDWVLVSRAGWIAQSAVRPDSVRARVSPQSSQSTDPTPGKGAAPTRRPAPTEGRGVPSPASRGTTGGPPVASAGNQPASSSMPMADSSDLVTPKGGDLRDAPHGRTFATLGDSARVRALFRDRGWVRVRIEGWMRDADVTEADTALRASLLPADLRADPVSTRGKLVRWDVQKLAIQNADPLQRDLAQDEPYMLARGPGADHPLLYLSLPPSLLASARKLAPLGFFTVIARVRNGRSSPGGVPILDVLSLTTK